MSSRSRIFSVRRTYAGMVAAMDEGIGQIVAALDEKGLSENTSRGNGCLRRTRRHEGRDIKPQNILFDESDVPFLADLGLTASEEELLDEPSMALGTPLYMPLEQADERSNRVDGRADIYSLGVIFYRLLSGRLPFYAKELHQYIDLLRAPDGPKPLRQIDAAIPLELEKICLQCLQANAKDRYQTAADISRDIRAWEQAVKARPRRSFYLATFSAIASAISIVVVALMAIGWKPVSPTNPSKNSRAANASGATSDVMQESTTHVDPIVFPTNRDSSWTPVAEGKALHVSSTSLSMLNLAQLQGGGSMTIEIDLHQLEWVGRVGIYWGHHVDEDGVAHFELLKLGNWGGDFSWSRLKCSYDGSDRLSQEEIARARVNAPQQKGRTVLIQMSEGQVSNVVCDGQPLTDLVSGSARAGRLLNVRGGIGVFNLRSAATYSNFKIDGVQLQMRKPRK